MSLTEQIVKSISEMKDAAIGSFIYFLYGHFIKKTQIWKGVISFIIGTITAQYLSPEVLKLLPSFHISFISFVCGLMGMKIAETLIDLDIKSIVKEKLTIKNTNS